MSYAKITLALLGMALLAACTQGEAPTSPLPLTEKQAKQYERQMTGLTAGEPVRCISNISQPGIVRISDDLLLYRVSGRLIYQNRLKSPCPGLARDNDVIVTEQSGSQQCSGDLLRLVDRVGGIPGPVCILGDFVPYRKDGTVTAD
jgi:hypothetical protein